MGMTLAQRCRIHADRMQDEGWYVTANVLSAAADELELRHTNGTKVRLRDDGRIYIDELPKTEGPS